MSNSVEIYGAERNTKRQVRYNGKLVEISGVDLRTIGAPEWLARRIERRQAAAAEQEQFRQRTRRKLEALMDPDPDARNRAKADAIAEEIEADEIGELSEDERNLIRLLRKLKLAHVS